MIKVIKKVFLVQFLCIVVFAQSSVLAFSANSNLSSAQVNKVKHLSKAFNNYYNSLKQSVYFENGNPKRNNFIKAYKFTVHGNKDLQKLTKLIVKDKQIFNETKHSISKTNSKLVTLKLIKKTEQIARLDIELYEIYYQKNQKKKEAMQEVSPFIVDFNLKTNKILSIKKVIDSDTKSFALIGQAKIIYTLLR